MNSPHDKFFKEVFSKKENAIDFIRGTFPAAIRDKLAFDTFRLEKTSYVDKALRETVSDLVYSAMYQGRVAIKLSLLFEHKSYQPKHPHLQILRYMLGIWEKQLDQKLALTPVIPIVIYHGKDQWRYQPFSAMFAGMDNPLTPFLPSFEYLCCDLSALSHGEIKDKIFREAGLRMACLALKHSVDQQRLRQYLQDIFSLGRHYFEEESGLEFLEAVLLYLYHSTELSSDELLPALTAISAKGGEMAMTTAEKLITKGKREGKREGVREGKREGVREGKKENNEEIARKMLMKGIEIDLIKDITGLSDAEIRQLRPRR